MAFLEAFLLPLLWVLGLGLGLVTVASVGFVVFCWFRSMAGDGPEEGGGDGDS